MRRHSLPVMLLVAVLMVPSLAFAATAADYRARVSEARRTVETALPRVADATAAQALADKVGTLLPATERVDMASGEVTVDNSGLQALVGDLDVAKNADARQQAAESILVQLTSQEAALGTTGTPPPADAALLKRILKDEGITDATDPRNALLKELQKLIDKLIAWFTAAGSRPAVKTSFRVVYYALLALSAAAVLWIATLIVRRLRASALGTDASNDSTDGAPVVAAAAGLPDDALAFADGEAAAGRYRDAVRALFGGAARELVNRGVVPRTQTRTTRELLGDVEDSRPGIVPPLRSLARAFEPAWYGHVDPGASGYADARIVYLALADMMLDGAGEAS